MEYACKMTICIINIYMPILDEQSTALSKITTAEYLPLLTLPHKIDAD